MSSGYKPEGSGYEYTVYISKWMGCRIKVAFSWSELYWSGPRVASVVALSCLTGHLWAVHKGSLIIQRCRLECRLYTAIDDQGFLLTNLFEEDSIKLEKMQERLIRLIEGTE